MNTDADKRERTAVDESTGEMSEAEIDSVLEDTFPASDPPPWTLGTDHRASVEPEPESGDLKDD